MSADRRCQECDCRIKPKDAACRRCGKPCRLIPNKRRLHGHDDPEANTQFRKGGY